ncbi:MAG: putative solute-binding protein [Moraxellaceae bacterium]|nr:DUF6091 family protein [Moraxellaceae bacterium]MDZ4297845.1 putative solute-binding protein [Moraxellaceae bacterium]MDZ4387477.1 putative solute-binding protein [Moraxellaceae bacterium]
MKLLNKTVGAFVLAASAATVPVQASASQTICVWDILGAQGDVYGVMRDWALQASRMGATVNLRAYTEERVAAADFMAGQCDGVVVTGMRGSQFNKFTGGLDSLGAIPNNEVLKRAFVTLSNPALAPRMTQGKYEVAGFMPAGAAYLFVKSRSINHVDKLAGQKIAVFDYDRAQARMVQKIGAQPVSSDISNFGAKFNNNAVDIIGAPAAAYKPLELEKGLGKDGAVIRFPVLQLTMQMYIDKSKFPADFGQKSRAWFATQLDRSLGLIAKAERDIPASRWMDLPAADKEGYVVLLRQSRIDLANSGFYDKTMMSLLRRIRCQVNAADAECSQTLE